MSTDPRAMMLAIHRQARHFMEPDCLKQLQRGSYPWLKDCLMELEIDGSFAVIQVLGILMALAAIGGTACSRIPMLMQELDAEKRKQVHQQFQSKLELLFPDADICKWFALNLEQMNSETYQLAKHLIRNGVPEPACYLTLLRLVKVSDRLDYYIAICDKLVATKRSGMLEEHLRVANSITPIPVEDFAGLALTLAASSKQNAIKQCYGKLVARPLLEWHVIIDEHL